MKPKRINIEFGNYGTLITVHVTYFRKNLNIKIREHTIYKTEIVSSLLIQNPGPFVPASFSCSVFKTY